ncbi:MAG: hypothetical protein Q7J44_20770 [Pseudotabrizicola sp.]|uniref:hypothetical protein n=1 Tax=Pseudotabrizicola sp. TaxID=2939647 RepID=UPI002718B8BA|nr:hypothetical protein [Pseudotabrizicola sp.]MDO9640973.1 hypothetical protein [Pseudotabrizicola sp.]
MFDTIYIVSLPGDSARRARLAEYLPAFGIDNVVWVTALGAESSEVAQAYASGLVVDFPPCFRCGHTDCGSKDCNNILVPPQVGNFLTKLGLWRRIAAHPQRALVLEDDVVFHEWSVSTLEWLEQQIIDGGLTFRADMPLLIRLGWALGADHTAAAPRVTADVRMSNPGYAITSAMAELVLKRFKKIDTTSDVFLHARASAKEEAITLLPPIASDLSWSVGSMPSTIHPKETHAAYLEQQGLGDKADAYRKVIRKHIKHAFWRRLLILGHPRTGTGHAAATLRAWGLDIGHEADGKDGICSWMLAVEDEAPWAADEVARHRAALRYKLLLHVVRSPVDAIPSIIREDRHAPLSLAYRRKHVLERFDIDICAAATELETSVMSLVYWSRLIAAQKPDLVFHVEDGLEGLRTFLTTQGEQVSPDALPPSAPVNADKFYRGLRHPKPAMTSQDWKTLSPQTRNLLASYCDHYRYPMP